MTRRPHEWSGGRSSKKSPLGSDHYKIIIE